MWCIVCVRLQTHLEWMDELRRFSASIGAPLARTPVMGYEPIDLYALYHAVTQVQCDCAASERACERALT